MILILVGMAGSGKTTAAHILEDEGWAVIRLSKVISDELTARNLEPTEANERVVREDLRHQFGMDVCIQRALPAIGLLQEAGADFVIEGLASLSELETLLALGLRDIVVVALFTPKGERYRRLEQRPHRPRSNAETSARDWAEVRSMEKGGPIALADYLVLNDSDPSSLREQILEIVRDSKIVGSLWS